MYSFFIILIFIPLIIFEASERLALQIIRKDIPDHDKFLFRKRISFLFPEKISAKYSWFYHIEWKGLMADLKVKKSINSLVKIERLFLARKVSSLLMYVIPISIIIFRQFK